MVMIAVSGFLGMQPRVGPRMLPDEYATYARDLRMVTGYLEGRNGERTLANSAIDDPNTKFVYRITRKGNPANNILLEFPTPNVDVQRGPLINDVYDRYYWASDAGLPMFSLYTRIRDGLDPYEIAWPAPVDVVANPVQGTVNPVPADRVFEYRNYVHTWVDEYGRESPPSRVNPATVDLAGDSTELGVGGGQTVRLNWASTTLPDTTGKPDLASMRIYRTVPGISSSAFFFVMEIDYADLISGSLDTIDDKLPAEVALNDILASTIYDPPPDDLIGMAQMPNGFMAGFRADSKDVLFCEPYRPHAWPNIYTLSVEDPVVGLAVFGTNLVILTQGTPYIATGVHPEAMSLQKVNPPTACINRRSIVPLRDGVLFAGEDGLMAISAAGIQNVTESMLTRNQWNALYSPATMLAARDGESTYVSFYDNMNGFALDFAKLQDGFTDISTGLDLVAVNSDEEQRRALISTSTNVFIYNNIDPANSKTYVWKSKEFFLVTPVNLGACQINADLTNHLGSSGVVRLTVWADGVQRFFGDVTARLNNPFKLPSGFKGQVWQFQLDGTLPVSRIVLAQTERELANG